jgi:hypothetical protein
MNKRPFHTSSSNANMEGQPWTACHKEMKTYYWQQGYQDATEGRAAQLPSISQHRDSYQAGYNAFWEHQLTSDPGEQDRMALKAAGDNLSRILFRHLNAPLWPTQTIDEISAARDAIFAILGRLAK